MGDLGKCRIVSIEVVEFLEWVETLIDQSQNMLCMSLDLNGGSGNWEV